MPTKIDVTGQRFGRLLVVGDAAPDGNKRTRYTVRCESQQNLNKRSRDHRISPA
jgi:hypothetical protein